MEPESGTQNQAELTAAELRADAAAQLKSARDLAKRVRTEAMHELEDARARVARIAAREEEMAERWAQLLEAENALAVAGKQEPVVVAPTLIAEATAEARGIIEQAREEARRIREEAMRLLAVAEGEKAESHEIAQSETERASAEAERVTAAAQAEAKRLHDEAGGADTNAYNKRGGRKLPRIGEGATSLLSEMSGLRARIAEEDSRLTG